MEICPENKLHRKILDDFTLNDLDAKFIDREELKKKINKLKEFRIAENIDYGIKEGFGRITYIDVVKKDEILKLLGE